MLLMGLGWSNYVVFVVNCLRLWFSLIGMFFRDVVFVSCFCVVCFVVIGGLLLV